MAELSATNILNQNFCNGDKNYWETVKQKYDAQLLYLQYQAIDLGTYIQNVQASNPYSPDLQRLQMVADNIKITEKQLQPLIANAEKHIEIAQQAAQKLGGGSRGEW